MLIPLLLKILASYNVQLTQLFPAVLEPVLRCTSFPHRELYECCRARHVVCRLSELNWVVFITYNVSTRKVLYGDARKKSRMTRNEAQRNNRWEQLRNYVDNPASHNFDSFLVSTTIMVLAKSQPDNLGYLYCCWCSIKWEAVLIWRTIFLVRGFATGHIEL